MPDALTRMAESAVASRATSVRSGPAEREALRGFPRWIAYSVTFASAIVFYALLTKGTFNPGHELVVAGFADQFYVAQAHALLHGRLNVSPTAVPGECFVYHGLCYGYFGLTPSLLRVPFLPLIDATDRSFTPAFMTAALVLAMGSALAIAYHLFADAPRTRWTNFLALGIALSLGPASVLVMAARPAVYEEAIAWSVAFALLAIYCFVRWWGAPRRGWAVLMVISLGLSSGARPTTISVGVALGAGIVVRALLDRRERPRLWRDLSFGAVVAVVPVVTCLGVYWLKFHTPTPSLLLNQEIGGPGTQPWWRNIRSLNHNVLQGPRFIPTTLVAYLRPDGLTFTSAFPFVNLRLGPTAGTRYIGIPVGAMYVEPFSTVPDDMPLFIAVVLAAAVYGFRRARQRAFDLRKAVVDLLRSPMTYCIAGTAVSCLIVMSEAFITNRYLADFFPFITVTLLVCLRFIYRPSYSLSSGAAVALASSVTLLLVFSLVVDLGLEYQSWWSTAP